MEKMSEMGNANGSIRDSEWSKTYSNIESRHNEAYKIIEEAISLEEQEKPEEALEKYKRGLGIIDDTLTLQVSCPDNPDTTWERARLMIQKMKKTKTEVSLRIDSLQSSLPEIIEIESPPSYQQATSTDASSVDGNVNSISKSYADLAAELEEFNKESEVNFYSEVIYTQEGVKLYFISGSAVVSSYSEPDTLTVAITKGENSQPKGILQVGNWIFPLVSGASPYFKTDYRGYVFPDIYSDDEDASVAIVLPPEADDTLENILLEIVGKQSDSTLQPQRQTDEGQIDISDKISNGILNGAWYLSWGIIKGAEKLGEVMNYGTPKLIDRLAPHHEPTDVDSKLIKGMQIAECTTKKVARVTGYASQQIGSAMVRLGGYLAPHIQKQGTSLLSSGFDIPEEEASRRMSKVLTVAASAVEGFSTIYNGLETSAGILGESLKNNSVKIIAHKYGTMASEVAEDTMNTAGNVYKISQHATMITPRGFVKKAAKGAGKGIVCELGSKPSTSEEKTLGL
ncbi:protein spartin [Coccinella septempunctata]|uniref:protein spartin n=1 Tax=Coccinella septempunctata TaxID=41139 RepID=UPI001D090BE2|nr:protein spartin [Coccinella septempunctata]XP_044762002.1 protein spartin [Coccinella septempunctata]